MINNLNDVISKIESNTPFAFTRWGDGEWYNLNKKSGQNCDGNIYYHDLGDRLFEIVSVPRDYHMGVQTLMSFSVQQANKYPQQWGDSDVFHKALMNNSLMPFIDSLRKFHVVYIGNESLKILPFINEFIEIPYSNIWNTRDDLMTSVVKTFDPDVHKIYCFSAGMATNVFIHDLWQINKMNTYIDVGSVFDPFVGRNTRRYHETLNVNKLKEK
jgi:hypothetical protein